MHYPLYLPGKRGATVLSRMGFQGPTDDSPAGKSSLLIRGTQYPAISGACVLEAEVGGISDTLRRIQRVCFLRCCCRADAEGRRPSPGTTEPSLQTWELSCSDRCVSKYMQVHSLVGTELARSVFKPVLEQQEVLEQSVVPSSFLIENKSL